MHRHWSKAPAVRVSAEIPDGYHVTVAPPQERPEARVTATQRRPFKPSTVLRKSA